MVPPPSPDAGAGILRSPTLAALPGLTHGFTTRALGSCARSRGPVLRALLQDGDGWTAHDLDQVHGAQVHEVPPSPATTGDGLVTATRGALLVVRTADCAPVLLAAVDGGRVVAVASAHAGWRGLVAGILPACVAALRRAAPGARLVAAIGPCIGPCCFEVGPEVAQPIRARFGDVVRRGTGDRSFADLALGAERELGSLGTEVRDGTRPPCTRCDPERFYSYRREGASAGRMAAFIGLAP